jgi:hypothetical protein
MSGENVKTKGLKRGQKRLKDGDKAALYCHLAPFISPLKSSSNMKEVT